MNEIAKKDPAKIITDSQAFLTDETIRGRLELNYYKGMSNQSYKLKFRCFTKGDLSTNEGNRVASARSFRRTFTENKPSGRGLSKVSPKFDFDIKAKDRDAYDSIMKMNKGPQPKKKLNRISFVTKETTNEEDNLMVEMKNIGGTPLNDLLQNSLADVEIDLTETLRCALQTSSQDPICLPFEIILNSKVPASIHRPVEYSKEVNFDQKREEMIQRTVYKRARTLVESSSTKEQKDRIDKPTNRDSLSVVSVLELYKNGVLVSSREVKIFDNSTILAKEVTHVLTGSIQRQVKFFFCCRKLSYLSYIFCLNDNKISESRQTLTFKLKAQFGLLSYFQYLDMKVKESIERKGECFSKTPTSLSWWPVSRYLTSRLPAITA